MQLWHNRQGAPCQVRPLAAQVLNANLEWTPMHTSTAFWKENAGKLADNSCQLLKVLLNLLKTGREVGPPSYPRCVCVCVGRGGRDGLILSCSALSPHISIC